MALLFAAPRQPQGLWLDELHKALPGCDLRCWPDQMGQLDGIRYAAVWHPPAGLLQKLPHLEVMFSLGAGVDALLKDPTLPAHIPLVRVNDPDLTMRMSEYVVMHVLIHHRQQKRLDAQQHQHLWHDFPTVAASAFSVGIMGLGVMGTDAAHKLNMMGYRVVGWSRTPKKIPDVQCFAGPLEFDAFLNETDILVCLLPATPETTGLINRATIEKLSRRGPFSAPIIINAGRGQQQLAEDILSCLNDGTLHAATLDVFAVEPLAPDDPLWSHPQATITPHCAAQSDPTAICRYIAQQIKNYKSGNGLNNLVDRKRGY